MSEQPHLETTRLILRPFDTARHLTDAYVGWLNDPEVVRYSEQRHRRHTLETCRSFIDGFRHSPSLLWAIEHKEGPHHIGNIHADIDPHNHLADIAIMIGARDTWGKGIGLEAWTAVLSYLREREDIRKITAGCMASNIAMRTLMQRSGMTSDGTRPAHYVRDGETEDLVYTSMFVSHD